MPSGTCRESQLLLDETLNGAIDALLTERPRTYGKVHSGTASKSHPPNSEPERSQPQTPGIVPVALNANAEIVQP